MNQISGPWRTPAKHENVVRAIGDGQWAMGKFVF
jgi:hypothetical protein